MDLLEKLFDLYITIGVLCFYAGGGLGIVAFIFVPFCLVANGIAKLYKAYRRL